MVERHHSVPGATASGTRDAHDAKEEMPVALRATSSSACDVAVPSMIRR